MIEFRVTGKNGRIERFSVTGHAGFAASEQDIVCAAISILVYNTINSCEKFADIRLGVSDKRDTLSCQVPQQGLRSAEVQLLLASMVYGVEQIEAQYPENIRMHHLLE